jgi:predicted glutamine amidotransferase
MCRLLYARGEQAFAIADLLRPFAELSRDSREFQGHGWGCAWLEGGAWRQYHDIRPVWEDDPEQFGETRLLLVHARSAFRDEGIRVENNMPFTDGRSVFIFNGELRGVRIRSEGRIGAEKIYNYIRRFDKGDLTAAAARAVDIIGKRSAYVRAMNFILSDGKQTCLSTNFSEDPDYFQLREKRAPGLHLVCSEPFPRDDGWSRIDNHATVSL